MRAGIRISSLVPSGLVIESVSDSSELDYYGRPSGKLRGRVPIVRGEVKPNP